LELFVDFFVNKKSTRKIVQTIETRFIERVQRT